jgi:hypothetical protein
MNNRQATKNASRIRGCLVQKLLALDAENHAAPAKAL